MHFNARIGTKLGHAVALTWAQPLQHISTHPCVAVRRGWTRHQLTIDPHQRCTALTLRHAVVMKCPGRGCRAIQSGLPIGLRATLHTRFKRAALLG